MLRAASILIALLFGADVGADSAWVQTLSGRLKSIAAGKTIKIAHRGDAVPFSFISDKDKNKNEPIGDTIDICKQIVASLERQFSIRDLKIEWIPVTAQMRFEAVANGEADLECGSSTVTLGRMKLVDFSNYVFVESAGLVVRTAVIRHLSDVAGKKIAVVAGTTNEKAMALQNQQRRLNAIVVPVKDRDEAVADLENGKVDAFASDKLLLVGTKFKRHQELRLLPDDLSVGPYAIVLPRGDWELRLAVNTALAELSRGGEVRKIFDRWFAQFGFLPGVLLNPTYLLGALAE